MRRSAEHFFRSFFSAETAASTGGFYMILAVFSIIYSIVAFLAPLITPPCDLPVRRQLGQGNTGGIESEPNPSYTYDACRWVRYAVLLGMNKWEADMFVRIVMSTLIGSIIGFERCVLFRSLPFLMPIPFHHSGQPRSIRSLILPHPTLPHITLSHTPSHPTQTFSSNPTKPTSTQPHPHPAPPDSIPTATPSSLHELSASSPSALPSLGGLAAPGRVTETSPTPLYGEVCARLLVGGAQTDLLGSGRWPW